MATRGGRWWRWRSPCCRRQGGRESGSERSEECGSRRKLSPLTPYTRPLPLPIHITLDVAEQSIQRKAIVYDGTGDEHYDAASALIKWMRGSDPDAAVYWVARMLEAGEDPRFIARRIAILASEDIGNADPQAIVVAAAAFDIVEKVGMPEAQLTLGQAAIYMATAPKSNASAVAIWGAMSDVREGRTLPVPKHLKDTHYQGSKRLGHGSGYKYAHDFESGFVRQDYLGVDKTYYLPTDRGFEQTIGERLKKRRESAAGPAEGGPDLATAPESAATGTEHAGAGGAGRAGTFGRGRRKSPAYPERAVRGGEAKRDGQRRCGRKRGRPKGPSAAGGPTLAGPECR